MSVRPVPSRRIAPMLGMLLSVAVAAAGAQAADSPAERQAAQAQAQLSARYAQLWPTLDRAGRAQFLAAQRHWLQRERWTAQHACLQALGLSDDDAAAACLAQVTRAQLDALAVAAIDMSAR